MGYENPRDRLELFLKKIIDKSTAPAERRTRFEQFLAGILDGSLVPDDPRNRLELYLKGVAESGGYIPPSGTITITANGIHTVEQYKYADVQVPAGGGTLQTDIRNILSISSIQTVNLGWKPDKLIVSWVVYEYSDEDPYYEQLYHELTGSGSIESGEDTVTFTSTGYTVQLTGSYWNDPDRIPAGEITVTAVKIS